ncbi:ATP-binding protein, partial [bacterium]|nr:ATP-binding protein [bacterium]
FDWKRAGYRDLLNTNDETSRASVMVYTVGREIAPFHFNPLQPPPRVEHTQWIKQFIQCLSHAYFLGHGCEMILQDVLHPKLTPTLRHVMASLQSYPATSRKLFWLQSTQRAIKALCYGGIDKVFNSTPHLSIEDLLYKNIIFELDALSDSEAKFFVEILLSAVYLYRKEMRHSGLRHVCVIEEAHHILSKEDKAKESKSVMDKLLREIREYGEAIIVVDQMPSSLLDSAMANLASKITFSLSLNIDVIQMADSMLLNPSERQWLGRLPVGVALIKLQNRWHSPFLVKIPQFKIQRGKVADEAVADRMGGSFAQTSLKVPFQQNVKVISPFSPKDTKDNQSDKREFVKDILKHPYSTMTKRYQRLRLNPRRGVFIKDHLLQKRLIKEVTIPTAKGRVKLLKLTELRHAPELGIRTSGWQKTSLEHQYWCEKIKHKLKHKGYTVFTEYSLKTGGIVDLLAVKDKLVMAVEVETGKSDILANREKCINAGINNIIFAATTKDAKNKIQAQLKKANCQNHSCIRIIQARYFSKVFPKL